MSTRIINALRRGFYLDSVALMRLSREIAAMPGIDDAALMMATPANKRILADAGLLVADREVAASNDLILAVRAGTAEAADAAVAAGLTALDKPRRLANAPDVARPRTLRGALRGHPGATLALISVPGDYAACEARTALRSGLDVLIFSANVSIEAEVALKREAKGLGRLVMGPDCGTAIINGTPLAFANRLPRGDIGVVGASGTGTQEVTCLIARGGKGISQAIGVGGRDLSREVGALSTLVAIDWLDADPTTRHIVVVSKPPHAEVARAVLARVGQSGKPFTICFLGASYMDVPSNARLAPTLRAAARSALGMADDAACAAPKQFAPRAGTILGLFTGGTLGLEAQVLLLAAGHTVASNAPVSGAIAIETVGAGADIIIDLGAEEFTRGRPHPMIDPAVRADKLSKSLLDRNVGVILLDIVIGFGAHADPAGIIAAALRDAPRERPFVVASVTGTDSDPQVRSRQVAALESAGVLVAPSNADAAELALALANDA
jgi:FdrA protein